jgi:hypothetical protein
MEPGEWQHGETGESESCNSQFCQRLSVFILRIMNRSKPRRFNIRSLILLFALLPVTGTDCIHAWATGTTPDIAVTSYLDTSSAGWAYKKSDYAFVAEMGACRIQWNAIEMKEAGGKRHLSVRRACPIPFPEQIPFHRAILKEIFSRWPAAQFDTISWGSFGAKTDWSWSIPIAVASSKSKEFKNYREKYPNVAININKLFVQLANETNSYNDFRRLMHEFDIDIELSDVEKVSVMAAKELPFFPVLRGRDVDAKAKVIYDVAFSYFRIK